MQLKYIYIYFFLTGQITTGGKEFGGMHQLNINGLPLGPCNLQIIDVTQTKYVDKINELESPGFSLHKWTALM